MDSNKLIEKAQRNERRGHHAAARSAYQSAMQRDLPEGVTRAAVLRWIGNTHRAQGNADAAIKCYRESLNAAEAVNAHADIAHALNWMAIVEQERGGVDAARKLYMRAMARAEQARDRRLMAMIGQNLGALASVQGQHTTALKHYKRSLQAYRATKDDQSRARLLNNVGLVHLELSAWAEAAAVFDEAAQLSEKLNDFSTRAMIEVNRTDMWFRQRELKQALRSCNRARALANRIDHAVALGEIYKWYGILYRELGSLEVAETHLTAAADIADRYQATLLFAEVQRERALLYRAQQRNHASLQALNDAHRAFAQIHARHMVNDIDNIMHELEEIFLDVVRQWGDSIERQDRYTAGHCQRVADYTCMLARAAGIDEKLLVWIRMGAFLHDVGKTAIPPEILNKNGPLSPEEWRVMKRHTVIGVELLSAIEFPWDIRGIVRSHHEHWDGSGYPDALRGEQIPVEARILCVADVYDALTTTRAYRKAFTPAAALELMKTDSGRVFDPELLRTFERLITPATRSQTSVA